MLKYQSIVAKIVCGNLKIPGVGKWKRQGPNNPEYTSGKPEILNNGSISPEKHEMTNLENISISIKKHEMEVGNMEPIFSKEIIY